MILILCGGFAWLLAHFTPGFGVDVPARLPIAAVLVLVGLALALKADAGYGQRGLAVFALGAGGLRHI